ncbi:DUF4837 family protein [Fodinibius sediminis]|uniref:DUF4837 domain-containing protein n=1 Tax=Fodinibius sediminis TaxID=1214077 RepID=A0A521B323_9BACT|nr:DUF4837 family protein [Fodinibius sediminis]SMO41170.1 protein of unknown function [Fodinibius sediminis]
MNLFSKVTVLLVIAAAWLGCEGDYRQKARGGFGEAIVVMDSTQWESETADAIRETFGQGIYTIPTPQPLFNLRFRDFRNNDQLDQLKRFKNIIIAAPIDDSTNTSQWIRALLSDEVEAQVRNGESFAFPLQDKWYQDQWSMILTAPSDTALAEQIRNSEKTLTDNILSKEFQRWKEEIYGQGEQTMLADSIWTEHGWKIRIQHDWMKNIDTTYTKNGEEQHFLTMRRPLPENNRWFWAWWKEDVRDISYLDDDWINAKRDSLMEQWIRGTRDSSYVTTEYARPVESESFRMNGHLVHETLGTWRMTHDAMGGPFVNFTIYDSETDRLFILEFGQFAPKYDKRRFVRQFRTMLRTFSSDSTWQGGSGALTEQN